MRILVTGHLGFIGTNLVKHLSQHDIVGLDLKNGHDILDCALPADVGCVIHLAGIGGVRESIEDPAKYWRTNVEGTRRILEHYQDCRVLVASSSSQYEPHLNPYAASKQTIEHIPHPDVCFMRFHTVYGPIPRSKMFFDKLINDTLEYVTQHRRDFIHVDDMVRAIDLLMFSGYNGPIDIGTGSNVRISDIRKDLPIRHDTLGERQNTLADTSKMNQLGFEARYTVKMFLDEQGIENHLDDECI